MIYGKPYAILAPQAWYNIRSFICQRHISSLDKRYHIEDISPVPQGTDIIEKSHLCRKTKVTFLVRKSNQTEQNRGKSKQKYTNIPHNSYF